MLHIACSRRLDEMGPALAAAAQHNGGAILAVTHLGQLVHSPDRSHDALVFTLCHTELYAALLAADIRFGSLLPCRVAVISQPSGVVLEALSPKTFCELVERPDLEPVAAPLERFLLNVMEEAGKTGRAAGSSPTHSMGSSPGALETQMSARGTVPQRIDCRGTKVEDLAGTGVTDAPGG